MEIEENKNEQTHLLSEEAKWSIVFYKKAGLGNRETARRVALEHNRPMISHQQGKFIWEKYTKDNQVTNLWNKEGRPHSLNLEQEQKLLAYVEENRNQSVRQYKEELQLQVTRQTINNVLLE